MKRNLIFLLLVFTLHTHIQKEFNAAFPDNEATKWAYRSVGITEDGIVLDVEPASKDFGYSRFRLTISSTVECSVMNDGSWDILFTK